MTQTSYVLPAGAGPRPSTTSTACPSGSTTSRPSPSTSATVRASGSARTSEAALLARAPSECRRACSRALAPQARARARRPLRPPPPLRAPGRAGVGAARTGRRSAASARTSARIRSRSSGSGPDPKLPQPSACRLPERFEFLAAAFAAREVLLVGAALVRVERVERVARGQLVNSGFHDPSWVESSRSSRSRASPANIRLLMVPSGTAEPLRELGLREPAVVRELERLTLRVGELLERGLHALALEVEPRCLLGGRCRRLAERRVVVERSARRALLAPHEIDRAPVDEREDPRGRLGAVGPEGRSGAPDERGTPPAPRPRRDARRAARAARARRRCAQTRS